MSTDANEKRAEQISPITSCSFTWENNGLTCAEDILSVKTRILPTEVQVRFYNGNGLIGGRIWPLPHQQKQELFDLLEWCCHEWNHDDYSIDVCDGSHWQLKVCAKNKCLRKIEGTVEPPPQGQKIRNMIVTIVGDDNCYVF